MTKIQLDKRDQASVGTDSYTLTDMEIGFASDYVSFTLTGENGEKRRFNFTGPEGKALLDVIMSSNASIKKLQKFALHYLVNNRHLVGTVQDE